MDAPRPKYPKYSISDLVCFFDDPEVGVVHDISNRDDGWYYLVKFGGTIDKQWPGFVYPEDYLRSADADTQTDPPGPPGSPPGSTS